MYGHNNNLIKSSYSKDLERKLFYFQESQVTHTPPMSIGSNHSQSNHHHVGGPPTPVTPTGHTHQSSHQQQQQQQQQLHHQQQLVQTPNSLNNSMANHSNSSMSSSLAMVSPSTTPTPPKKDRNTRKSCAYCNKDFHEMSLKRHIKDMHFRSQNTYVICPQCGKQYASQVRIYCTHFWFHEIPSLNLACLPKMEE